MLKISGVVIGLVLQNSGIAAMYPLSHFAYECNEAATCKMLIRNDCLAIYRTIQQPDLFSAQDLPIAQTKVEVETAKSKKINTPKSYKKVGLLNSKTFGMLFPVR